MESSCSLCGRLYDSNIFMVRCDLCNDWFHGSCCNVQENVAAEIETYHCPRCAPVQGKSMYKPYRNWHRNEFWDTDANDKPVQAGTTIFIKGLREMPYPSASEIIIRMTGRELTPTSLQRDGFNYPIVINRRDGLDMAIPPDYFSLDDIECAIGSEYDLDIFDVTRQIFIRMQLKDYITYFHDERRTRAFNFNFQVSDTQLARMVQAPLVVRKLNWVNAVWPRRYVIPKPQLQNYCLINVKDSYVDFHIDYSGASMWYHVARGEEIFFFVRPTQANLELYEQWIKSDNRSETFFGDQVDRCYKATLTRSQTILIPTGWIYACLTRIDTLVFGGSFLHSLNICNQLYIYELQKRNVELKFLYPHFETINWFAAHKLLKQLCELNLEEKKCPSDLFAQLKALLFSLKQWDAVKDYNVNTRRQIPCTINPKRLFKEIAKEIRHAEWHLSTTTEALPEENQIITKGTTEQGSDNEDVPSTGSLKKVKTNAEKSLPAPEPIAGTSSASETSIQVYASTSHPKSNKTCNRKADKPAHHPKVKPSEEAAQTDSIT